METIEDKLKLEKDIIDLRHQYKLVYNQTNDAKSEYNAIVLALETKTKFLEEQKTYLAKVIDDISQAKLNWAVEKDEEWQKVNAKLAEAENVIKRKQELNEQEEELRKINQETTDKLNEQRRLELKNNQENTLFEVEKRQFSEEKKKFIAIKAAFLKDKENFKEELSNFIKSWQMKF